MSDESKSQQLWTACTEGNLDLVKLLLDDPAVNPNEESVNVNWAGPEKCDTPLHRACRFGHLQVAEFMIGHPKVDVNAGNAGQASPFYLACQEGHLDVMSLLLNDKRVDVNKLTKWSQSFLHGVSRRSQRNGGAALG